MKLWMALGLLLSSSFVNAQKTQLNWSETNGSETVLSIIGGNQQNYFATFMDKQKQLVGQIYDSKLNIVTSKVLNVGLDHKNGLYLGAYVTKDKIRHIFKERIVDSNSESLVMGTSDLSLEMTEAPLTIVASEQSNKISDLGSRVLSPDEKHVLFYHQKKAQEGNQVHIKIFDALSFNKVSGEIVTMPSSVQRGKLMKAAMDNTGKVYFLYQVPLAEGEWVKRNAKTKYQLISVAQDGKLVEAAIYYPEREIVNLELFISGGNEILLVGFLSEIPSFGVSTVSNEMTVTKFDSKTLNVEHRSVQALPGLYPDKIFLGVDDFPYFVKNIFPKEGGGYAIVAEQYILKSIFNSRGTQEREMFGDIVCVQLDAALSVLSVSRQAKIQLDAENPSFLATTKGGNTYVVYEDVQLNSAANSDKEMFTMSGKSGRQNALMLLSIDAEGKMTKQELFSYTDLNKMPLLRRSKVLGDGVILLNGKDQIGVLNIL